MKEIRKKELTVKDIAYIMDPSALKLDTCFEDVMEMVKACKEFGFGCCFAWPCYYDRLHWLLQDTKTLMGVSLGFPSGQECTDFKVFQAKQFKKFNPSEVDMVMNVGLLKSKRYGEALDDIIAVKEVIGSISLKVIIESMLLSDEEIRTACKIVVDSGANYVKTGTGFSVNNPTSLHEVDVILNTIDNKVKVKVAGGVRDLDTLLTMYAMGVSRFGVGYKSAISIVKQAISQMA